MKALIIPIVASLMVACGGSCEPPSAEEQQAALLAIAAAQQQGNPAKQLSANAHHQALVERCD